MNFHDLMSFSVSPKHKFINNSLRTISFLFFVMTFDTTYAK